jgi:hypothetical protein
LSVRTNDSPRQGTARSLGDSVFGLGAGGDWAPVPSQPPPHCGGGEKDRPEKSARGGAGRTPEVGERFGGRVAPGRWTGGISFPSSPPGNRAPPPCPGRRVKPAPLARETCPFFCSAQTVVQSHTYTRQQKPFGFLDRLHARSLACAPLSSRTWEVTTFQDGRFNGRGDTRGRTSRAPPRSTALADSSIYIFWSVSWPCDQHPPRLDLKSGKMTR